MPPKSAAAKAKAARGKRAAKQPARRKPTHAKHVEPEEEEDPMAWAKEAPVATCATCRQTTHEDDFHNPERGPTAHFLLNWHKVDGCEEEDNKRCMCHECYMCFDTRRSVYKSSQKDIDEEMINLYTEVRNIYQQKFPQLSNILVNPFEYLLVVQRIGGEDDLSKVDFSDILPNALIMTLTITATHSKSAPIEKSAMDRVGMVLLRILKGFCFFF